MNCASWISNHRLAYIIPNVWIRWHFLSTIPGVKPSLWTLTLITYSIGGEWVAFKLRTIPKKKNTHEPQNLGLRVKGLGFRV
jgi:hypothetical protein